ncbi:MAG: tRNA preQ1(34) S-adenosylmethionine ribosyltransferase-isomerase QueA [Myxococcota bacterium]|nr:tRNA preQ1(34) S-adenosylmethionine ribosyltransferase-isomerase QueA [Myxococcota bacterium]
MDLAEYDFEVPPEQIAQQPSEQRDGARLLHLSRSRGQIAGEYRVPQLSTLLREGDLLVVNATRVLSARLTGIKTTGGKAEALLLEPDPSDRSRHYRALIRSGGRLRVGLGLELGDPHARLHAEVTDLHESGEVTLAFEDGPDPFSLGTAPLPPYIERKADGESDTEQRETDRARYQTVYAREPGAVAAPTAGLHLTESGLEALRGRGIGYAEVILHVGAGTFRPIDAETIAARKLHRERFSLPPETAEAIDRTRREGGRVIAVGTTTTRVLETRAESNGRVSAGEGSTELFIQPGDPFRVVDGLMTNFHLPRSSLILLVAAFAGKEPTLHAYQHAIQHGYRFYSYGDAMLIL